MRGPVRPLMRPQRSLAGSGRTQFGSYHYFWGRSRDIAAQSRLQSPHRSALLATALLGDTLYLLVIVPLSPGLASGLFLRSANVTSVAADKAKPRRGRCVNRRGSGARKLAETSEP